MSDNTTFHNSLDSAHYDASHIKVLEGLEPVRQRPGMYIGSTDIKGLHHMIQEIVDNGVDEAIAGYCTHITTVIHSDGSVTVYDNGRGIPVDKHEKTGKSALETVFTVLHAGGKFEKSAYKVSGGLHGVGASVVNALSERLEVTVHKNGKEYFQRFEKWVPQGELKEIGESDKNGTTVYFKPDGTVFETLDFVLGTEVARMKNAAYLTPGVSFTLIDERVNYAERFCFEGGIKTWLSNMVDDQEIVSQPHYLNIEGKECMVECSFQFLNSTNENLLSFVNNIPTKDGGTHVVGFKEALLTRINELAKEKDKVNKKIGELTMQDMSDGLYAIVTVKIPEPQFQWQTKGKLGNSYVRTQVYKIIYDYITDHFNKNPDEFEKIFEKIELSARARLAAVIAKESIIRKNVLGTAVLPGKLSDCRRRGRNGTELYLVEGDSAWGTAKQGRDSEYQAILWLRGKVLNTEQAHIQKILANNEIKSLITAIGCGLRDSYDEETLRYQRVIVMTDADVDGAHIRTLLLTFFFRYMRPLIENGHLFIACPPIYRITQGKKDQYFYPPIESPDEAVIQWWFDPNKAYEVQRYKGLGEMNAEQLRDTTMDPTKRKLFQVNIEDAEEADRLFRVLMGEDVSLRKHFILTHAKGVKSLDL
jgi:DNA gyrase subunit B